LVGVKKRNGVVDVVRIELKADAANFTIIRITVLGNQ